MSELNEGAAMFARARQLLGQQVIVTLSHDDREPDRIARGTLLKVADSGEVCVEDEMGFVHYCWPMLDVAPTPEPPAMDPERCPTCGSDNRWAAWATCLMSQVPDPWHTEWDR